MNKSTQSTKTQGLIDIFTKGYGKDINKWNWIEISEYRYLTEDFIREFKDKVDWWYISYYQELSESFIREFKDKVEWNNISYYQELSEDFIREFKDKIDLKAYYLNNPYVTPQDKIKWMRQNGIIEQYNPNKHLLQSEEDPKKDTDLQKFKDLLGKTNTITDKTGKIIENKEVIPMKKESKNIITAQHIHKDDYPNVEDMASYTEALKLFKIKGKISDPELKKLIDNLPSPQNIRKSLSNNEIKIVFRTVWYLWNKITGFNLVEDTKVEQKKETLEGNYWMLHKGVLITGPNHYTIIKNNLNLFRSLLGIHAFTMHDKLASDPNDLIKLILDNGGIRIFVNQDRISYFQLSSDTYAKWGKKKILKYEFNKKIVKVIDTNSPYRGWRTGISIILK